MADKTINDLTDIAAAPAGASFVPVWESGATKKVSVSNLLTDAGGGLPLSGGTLTGSIVPPNNAYAIESPTRSIGFGMWDGFPAIVAGSTFPSSFDNGYTLASDKRIGWSSTTTGGSAWRDTALERESAGVIVPYQDDTHDLGSATKRFDDIYATNTTISSSDETLKRDVVEIDDALSLVKRLRPVSYRWRDYSFDVSIADENGNATTETRTKTHSRNHWGLIAQEFKQALTDAGIDASSTAAFVDPAAKGGEGKMGIRYAELIPLLISAIQELSARVESLEA